MSRHIFRDPFARTTLTREQLRVTDLTCSWCGCQRSTPNGGKFLYRYQNESDGGAKAIHRGLFCSKSCHDAYHG